MISLVWPCKSLPAGKYRNKIHLKLMICHEADYYASALCSCIVCKHKLSGFPIKDCLYYQARTKEGWGFNNFEIIHISFLFGPESRPRFPYHPRAVRVQLLSRFQLFSSFLKYPKCAFGHSQLILSFLLQLEKNGRGDF